MIATLLAGLSVGAVYVLVAIGYNLTWLTTRALNFAQGAFMVSGMFLTVALYDRGLPAILVIVVLAGVGAVLAAVEFALAVRPVMDRSDHAELVTTLGAATVIQGVILLVVVDDVQRVPFFGPETLIDVPGGRVSPAELVLILATLAIGVGAHAWTRYSRAGLAALALSEDREAAMLLGVNTVRYSYLTFMASGALALATAPFVGPKTLAAASLVLVLAIKGFVVLAVGGLGSQVGALVAGFGVGIIESLSARELGASWQNASVYLVFLVVILLRPRGLFGARQERYV